MSDHVQPDQALVYKMLHCTELWVSTLLFLLIELSGQLPEPRQLSHTWRNRTLTHMFASVAVATLADPLDMG